MAHSATISSKGQVVIPAPLRKKYGLKEGSRIVFVEQDDQLVITHGAADAVLALCGKYAGVPLEEYLAEERRLEMQREEKKISLR